MTVVFDAGQNSADNFAHLAEAGLQFVGSLPPSDYPDLTRLARLPPGRVDADRFRGLTAYDTQPGRSAPAPAGALTHSPHLHARQARGFDGTTGKAGRKLAELAAPLERGRTRRDKATVQADIDKITRSDG